VVGGHEAAGAIPVIQTAATAPRRDTRLRISLVGVRFLSVAPTRYVLDVAQQESAWVTTTMSLVRSQSSRP
jgi:hypothetical protein